MNLFMEIGIVACVWLFAIILVCIIVAFVQAMVSGELKEKR